MRRLMFFMSILVVLSFAFVVVQGRPSDDPPSKNADNDDHDDKAPMQSGYAVVTAAGTSSAIAVFETFGMRHEGKEATQAGVLPPNLTTDAILFVDSNGRLAKNLGVAIVNPSTSQDANVTLTLRKADGTTAGSTMVTVKTRHQVSKFITELFASQAAVPKDITGTLVLTSNIPVSAIGLRFRGANFSTIPLTDLSFIAEPPGTITLPQFAAGGGWATEIVIANTGTSSVTVQVDLFKPDGTPLTATLNKQTGSSFPSIVIPGGGVYILAPRNSTGDDDF